MMTVDTLYTGARQDPGVSRAAATVTADNSPTSSAV